MAAWPGGRKYGGGGQDDPGESPCGHELSLRTAEEPGVGVDDGKAMSSGLDML